MKQTAKRPNADELLLAYRAGARLARTGGRRAVLAAYCKANYGDLDGVFAQAVRLGYRAEMAKAPADRRGRLG